MKLFLFAALSLAGVTFAFAGNAGRIVGGEEATPNEFKWLVSLQYYGSHICGATIYDNVTLITAAHCIVTDDVSALTIKAGKHHLYEFEATEQHRDVSRFVVHVGFPGTTGFSNDIAILKLSQPLFFNDAVGPLAIPPSMHTATGNVIVSGWGVVREGGSLPEKLRKVELPTIDDNQCKNAYTDEYFDGSNMICCLYPPGGRDGCTGDSGGPMIANDLGDEVGWYLAGIISWGYGCARPGYPSVYTEVSMFKDFIEVNSG